MDENVSFHTLLILSMREVPMALTIWEEGHHLMHALRHMGRHSEMSHAHYNNYSGTLDIFVYR